MYSAGRAYLRASVAFRAAVTAFVRGFGMHQRFDVRRRPQHIIRASGNAQLASGAVRSQMPFAFCTRRQDASFASRSLLLYYGSQAAIYTFTFGIQGGRSYEQSRSGEHLAATHICTILFRCILWGRYICSRFVGFFT